MSESGRGTQSTQRPLSSTGESGASLPRQHTSIESLSDPRITASPDTDRSARTPSGPFNPTQLSSIPRSGVATQSQGSISADTSQASRGLTKEEYINLLAMLRKRMGDDNQLTDAFSGEGFSAVEGSHDCVSTLKTSAGVPLHGRQVQHKETVINRLPPTHSHWPLKRFADANHCKVVYCATSSCPSYRIPSLRKDSDHVDGSGEGTDGGVPKDLEMLIAEFGLEPGFSDLFFERAESALKAFGEDVDRGRRVITRYWGDHSYYLRPKAIKGWSHYHTNRNINIVEDAMGNYKSAQILLTALQGEDESVVQR